MSPCELQQPASLPFDVVLVLLLRDHAIDEGEILGLFGHVFLESRQILLYPQLARNIRLALCLGGLLPTATNTRIIGF